MSTNPHEEVVGFDVAVNEVFVVNILNSANHLKKDTWLNRNVKFDFRLPPFQEITKPNLST